MHSFTKGQWSKGEIINVFSSEPFFVMTFHF